MTPATATRTGWSAAQRRRFLQAATLAGWNDQQRYMAMRHAGCRDHAGGRPSVKSPRNSNGQFEQVMAIAEAHALGRGRSVPPPARLPTWRAAAAAGRLRSIELARAIAGEGVRRLPHIFRSSPLPHAVAHVTAHDQAEFGAAALTDVELCDGGQVYRVVECLKAWVGRQLAAAGLKPETFNQPAEVYRRMGRAAAGGSRDGGPPVEVGVGGAGAGGARAPARPACARGRASADRVALADPGGREPDGRAAPSGAGAVPAGDAAAGGP